MTRPLIHRTALCEKEASAIRAVRAAFSEVTEAILSLDTNTGLDADALYCLQQMVKRATSLADAAGDQA